MAHIRPAVREDCSDLAPCLREEDIAEVRAASGREPEAALLEAFDASNEPCVIVHEGRVIGMFGVCHIEGRPDVGAPWMLCSPELVDCQITFLRRSKPLVELMQAEFPILWNLVDARNDVHIRWLQWLGFKFTVFHPEYGAERRPFWEFVRYNHV